MVTDVATMKLLAAKDSGITQQSYFIKARLLSDDVLANIQIQLGG